MARLGNAETTVLHYEFKAGLNEYLAKLGPTARVKSLKELIAYNEAHAASEMPFFAQEHFVRAEAKGPLTSQEYLDAVEKCRLVSRTEGIDAVMDKHNVEALVAPSGGPAGVTDLIYGGRSLGGCSGPAARPSRPVPRGSIPAIPRARTSSCAIWAFTRPSPRRSAYDDPPA